jgi:soluble lytic murein transglycosylase-like protein
MKRLTGAAVFMVALMMATPAQAHTPSEQQAWYEEWNLRVEVRGGITDLLIAEYLDFKERHEVRVYAPVATVRPTDTTHRGMGTNTEQWRGLVAEYFGSETDLALCVMEHESGGNPEARNPTSGAAGLFQIMPFWWEAYGGDRYNPTDNVALAKTIRDQQGWTAWAAYNRGKC